MLPFLKQAAESNSELPIGVERAAIINISSSLASIADNNDGGYYAYRCSKVCTKYVYFIFFHINFCCIT